MARIRVISTDPERIEGSTSLAFDAEFIRVGDLTQRPPGYPSFLEWPPGEWVGVRSELEELTTQLRTNPPTERIVLGISDPTLLATLALEETIQVATERGVGADIIVDLDG